VFLKREFGINDKGDSAKYLGIALDDDYTRGWSLAHYSSFQEKRKHLSWVVNGIMITNIPAVLDIEQKHINKGAMMIDETLSFVRANVDYVTFPLEHLIKENPHLFECVTVKGKDIQGGTNI